MPSDIESATIDPIGIAHTPYESSEDAPHQGFADDAEATNEVFEPYAAALAGIEECHRPTVVYWADRADRDALVGGTVSVRSRRGRRTGRIRFISVPVYCWIGRTGNSVSADSTRSTARRSWTPSQRCRRSNDRDQRRSEQPSHYPV
ncbi:hypothetical protein SAMN05216285_2114 [Natrinema salifodinae]|uniref:TsaA-like domain-containing protein n=1 Tax=Natrinema salifodinae TaxID=1202768 RepID=A0A1I0P4H7_9EURY|nr:hypothetical protein [Natrinema salifodinae]SEW08955.1 hypothetical protein SAMN05216285_2114 [Natrinema salifodinae]